MNSKLVLVCACGIIVLAASHADAAAVSWATDSSGFWNVPTNWSSDPSLPGPSDDVTIDRGTPNPTITHNTGNDSIQSLTANEAVVLSGGTLTIANPSSIGSTFSLSGGTLNGAANITVNGTLALSAGTIGGAGATTIAGTLQLTGGNVSRSIVNNGSAAWTDGDIGFNNGSFTNNSTVTATAVNHALADNGGTNSLTNTATFNANPGPSPNAEEIRLPWNNSGIFNIQSGTLNFTRLGTNSGAFTVASTATFGTNSNNNYNAGTLFNGTGLLNFFGGTQTFNTDIAFGNRPVNLTNSTFGGAGNLSFDGSLTVNNGTASGAGTLALSATGVLNLQGSFFLNRVLNSSGQINWTNGDVFLNSGTLNNNNVFTGTSANHALADNGGTNSFTNSGTVNANPGIGNYEELRLPFNNSGSINVQSGSFYITRAGTNSGAISIPANTVFAANGNITYNAGTSFPGTGEMNFYGGTHTFSIPIAFGSRIVDINGATLTGSGDLNFDGPLNWQNGAISGSGQTNIHSSSSVGVYVQPTLSRVLNNSGQIDLFDSDWFMTNGTLNNINILNFHGADHGIVENGGTNAMTSTGTINSDAGPDGYYEIRLPFNNSGAINILSGNLSITRASTNSGPFSIPAGTSLSWYGTDTFNAGTAFGGTGELDFFGGTQAFNLPMNFGNRVVAIQNATLTGPNDFTLLGPTSMTNSTISGAGLMNVNSSASLLIGGDSTLSRTLNNSGSIELTAANWFLTNGAINNSGTITCSNSNRGILENGGTNSMTNFPGATINSDPGVGFTSELRMPFTNSGAIKVLSGTLLVTRATTNSGSFDVPAGNSLTLSSIDNYNAGTTFTGAGNVNFTGGTHTFNTPVNFGAHPVLLGGMTLTGGSDVTFAAPLTLLNITMSGAGHSILTPACTASFNTDSTLARTLDNNGVFNWNAGNFLFTGGTFNNNGIINASVNARGFLENGGTNLFNNTGTFIRHGGGSAELRVPTTNSGTIDVQFGDLAITRAFTQPAGLTQLSGGSISGNSTLNFNGGTLKGAGNITAANVNMNGSTTTPGLSPGTLNIIGNYTQSGAAVTNIEIGGLANNQVDRILVTGSATITGTLNVSLVNAFVPSANNFWINITGNPVSGTFSTQNLPSLPGRLRWHVVYHPTSVEIRVILPGDTNCDGVMTLADLPGFVQALIDPAGYLAANPSCDTDRADMNNDGNADGLDIQLWINTLLTGG